MTFIDTSAVNRRELFLGVSAALVHADTVTVAHVVLKEGSVVPTHSHVHEQVINVLEGKFEMTIGDETKIVTAGFVGVVPSNVPHSVKVLTDGRIIDVFHPVREDLK